MRLSGSFLHRSEASISPRFFKEHSENNFICDRDICQQALPKMGGPVNVGRSGGIRTRGLLDPNDAQCIANAMQGGTLALCGCLDYDFCLLGLDYSPISFTLR